MAEVIQSIAGVVLFAFLYVRQNRMRKQITKDATRKIQQVLWQDRQIRKGVTPNVGRVNGSDSGR